MEKVIVPIEEQIKHAMDGRTQRWLSLEVKIAEAELSKKLSGAMSFTEDELERIEDRLSFKINK